MTKSHKLFQLINQISVMRVWGYTCMQGKGLGFLLSVLFMALLCRLWVTRTAGDSELHWAHLTVRHVPYTRSHPQCLIGYQPLEAPPKPVFTFNSPKPRHFTDPPPAWLLITLRVLSAFCDTLLHLPPPFWNELLCCCSSSVHKSQNKPVRESEVENSISVILSLSSSLF